MKNLWKIIIVMLLVISLSVISFSEGMCDETDSVQKVMKDYYNSIKTKKYGTAYSLLTEPSREYYGSLDNYISTFEVAGIEIVNFKIYKVDISDNTAKTKTVVTYTISGAIFDAPVENAETYKDNLVKENGKWKIKGKFGPYKSVALKTSSEKNGLSVVLYAIDLYPDFISVNLSFNNLGSEPLMILPYNENTFLSYSSDRILPTVELPYTIDYNLYSGTTLEPGTRILGFINFDGRWCKITNESLDKLPDNIDTVKLKAFLGKEYPKEVLRDKLFDLAFDKESCQVILDSTSYDILPRNIKKLDLVIGGNVNLKSPPPFKIEFKNIQL